VAVNNPTVIIFTHKLIGGGAEVAAIQLAVNFKRLGHRADIFCLKNVTGVKEIGGVKVFSPVWVPCKFIYLFRVLKILFILFFSPEYRLAKVVTFQTDMNLLILLTTLLLRSRREVYVCERSDPFLYPEHRLLRVLRRIFYKYSQAVICQTQYARDFFLIDNPKFRTRVTVCRNILKASSAMLVDNKVPRSALYLRMLCVGRLAKQKKIDDALMFISSANRMGYTCTLDVVGDGPEWCTLQKLSEQLGCSESVCFFGYRELKPGFFRNYDALLHPSELEGMSNTVLEAMHSGVPAVVSSGCLPMREVVENFVNGFSVEDFSDENSIREILTSLSDEICYQQLSAAAAAAALPFSSDIAVHEWSDVVFPKDAV
jgi:glycosyltransferase involved in cell wall biosynthesis